MVDQNEVRRLAMGLPAITEASDRFAFSVVNKGKPKAFIWAWAERIDPKKARVQNPKVLAITVQNLQAKEVILASYQAKFFTEPHYNNFPAILVRLEAIETDELADLIIEAWRCKAPKELIQAFDEE